MSLRVTVTDEQTGDTGTAHVADGDYLLICTDPCYLDHTQANGNGTHTLTVKGCRRLLTDIEVTHSGGRNPRRRTQQP